MKRLVSVFLVLCMMLSCVAFGETLDGAQGEIMNEVSDVASDEVQTPDEPTQAPVNEDDIVLPDMDDDISILPSDDVNGPDPYRELVLLQPTDLIGTTLSETSVRIGWGSVAFATQYDVYRKLGGEDSYTLLGSVPNNRLYYEDTNVTPGQAVYYRVRAVNVSYDGEQAKYVYMAVRESIRNIPSYHKPVGRVCGERCKFLQSRSPTRDKRIVYVQPAGNLK